MTTITLKDIRQAAETLASANLVAQTIATKIRTEIDTAYRQINARHKTELDMAAESKAEAHRRLVELVEASPQLFAKSPRSLSIDGVRAGYRKGEDSLDWDSDDAVIKRIRALIPDSADLLIRTEETLVNDGLAQLPAASLQALGVRRIPGVDTAFVTIGASDIDAMVKLILAAAEQRQGEAEKPKKRGKAKVKEAA